jgi:hypothetical protein
VSTTGSSQSLHRSGHADDYFFLSMALLVLGTVFVGFAPTFYMAGVFHAKLPSLLVHAHGAVFSSWIILLLAQTILISAGRVTWHKRLGILGIVLAVLMFILGFATLVAALRRHFEAEIVAEQIFSYDALHLSLFALLVLWAVLVRTDGPAPQCLPVVNFEEDNNVVPTPILAPHDCEWSAAVSTESFVKTSDPGNARIRPA